MTELELRFIEWLRSIATPTTDAIFEFITSLAEQSILIAILVIIYFFYSKKTGQNIAFTIFFSMLLNNSLKGLVGRVRPFKHPQATFEPARVETATGASFPSGHTQNATVAYTLFSRLFKSKGVKWVAAILIALVGISRLVLGVHYPSDVLAAIVFGLGSVWLGSYLHKRYEDDFQKQIVLYALMAVFFLPFVFIFWRKDYNDIVLFKDFYSAYAFYLGYVVAIYFEKKVVDFDCTQTIKVRLIRTILAVVVVIAIQFGLKLAFPEHSIFFDMLRYFLLALVTLGIYPILTKKWLFYKTEKKG
ncbi:MAG TPA: phosphatase PAP2 family protein [Bacilli bacterium]|nr:MAG: Undecaprenyl-diphosphatase BcrC [Tenericutes bacterium ADurb.BinA124]HNZ49974.1 phosphatase PAP2 family protein [Bacilli bacterium]HOH17840.1 phosphatase PAP2 family protein [Bacilli bacterium]HPN60604.1 phosphatase PAP2 family protein [Bacilli bacterium]HPX84278.1 phosphatase PAP2 family protein [Bacilli bacterium]